MSLPFAIDWKPTLRDLGIRDEYAGDWNDRNQKRLSTWLTLCIEDTLAKIPKSMPEHEFPNHTRRLIKKWWEQHDYLLVDHDTKTMEGMTERKAEACRKYAEPMRDAYNIRLVRVAPGVKENKSYVNAYDKSYSKLVELLREELDNCMPHAWNGMYVRVASKPVKLSLITLNAAIDEDHHYWPMIMVYTWCDVEEATEEEADQGIKEWLDGRRPWLSN